MMYKITTHVAELGNQIIEIGTAATMEQAREKVSDYFHYVQYEGADSFDRDAIRNVTYTFVPDAPPPIEDLLTKDASTIQHTLAANYRANTGHTPRGQLWQPCERHGCNREPVCMNCMLCEEKHCTCFD